MTGTLQFPDFSVIGAKLRFGRDPNLYEPPVETIEVPEPEARHCEVCGGLTTNDGWCDRCQADERGELVL